MRTFRQQFDPTSAGLIKDLIASARSIRESHDEYRLFTNELAGCLENGLLFAATLTCGALLELFVVDLVIALRGRLRNSTDEVEMRRDVEESKARFADLLAELIPIVISQREADEVQAFYEEIRIPLSHALILRFASTEDIFASLAQRHVEERIEDESLARIKLVLSFVTRHLRWLRRSLAE